MARKKEKPLWQEIDAVLASGELFECQTIALRMQSLPESSFGKKLDELDNLLSKVEEAEKLLELRRLNARSHVQKMLKEARKNWTKEEIEAATGYSVI